MGFKSIGFTFNTLGGFKNGIEIRTGRCPGSFPNQNNLQDKVTYEHLQHQQCDSAEDLSPLFNCLIFHRDSF